MAIDPLRCPSCGASLPVAAPEGLCPACVFRGLDAELTADEPWVSASTSEKPRRLGDYELVELLARGGMGLVYKARQRSLGRWVAVKVMSGGVHGVPDFVERFRTEAEAAAALDHPHIVPIFEVGESDGQPFFSMKLLTGGTLVDRSRAASLTPRRAAELLVKVARAVHYAHQRGILHRDIKPNNILLDTAGEPFLTDFGLAKLVDRDQAITHTIAMLGTPAYMSPEQARGEARSLTTAADVYGLGAVLYELLTGQPPFAGGVSIETVRLVLETDPRRPSTLNSAVDRDLETICLRCLEKDPIRRYGSAEAFADDLERWLQGQPIHARPTTALERLVKWARRRPAIAALSGGVVAALCAMIAISTVFTLRLAEERRKVTAEAEANRRGGVRLLVAGAVRACDDGDYFRALVPLAEAVRREADARQGMGEEIQRRRFGVLLRQCPTLRHLWLHESTVNRAQVNPDGRLLAVGTRNGTAAVWNLDSGEPVTRPLSHTSAVTQVVFGPDSRLLATQEEGGLARLWNLASGSRVGPALPVRSSTYEPIVFAPDGKSVAVPGPDFTRVWSTDGSGECRLTLTNSGVVQGVDFSSDGDRLVLGGMDGNVRMWDVATGREAGPVLAHPTSVRGTRFLPGGHRLMTIAEDWSLRIWDLADASLIRAMPPDRSDIFCWASSADGRWIATGGFDNAARVWDPQQPGSAQAVAWHQGAIMAVDFGSEGETFLTGSLDGNACRWRVATGDLIPPKFPHAAGVPIALVEPNGSRLLTASLRGDVRQWNLVRNAGAQAVLELGSAPVLASFAATNRIVIVVAQDGTAQRWAVDREDAIPWTVHHGSPVTSAALDGDARQLATGGKDGSVAVWEIGSAHPVHRWMAHGSSVSHVHFDARNELLLTASTDGTAGLWRIDDGTPAIPPLRHRAGVTWAELSPDGRWIATCSSDGECRIWERATGKAWGETPERLYAVPQVRFSPDGRQIVAANWDWSMEPRAALLWRPWDTTPTVSLLAQRDGVLCVRFSADGHRVATGGEDNLARVWSTESGQAVTPFLGHRGFVVGMAFGARDRLFATASRDGTARVWDVADGQPVCPPLRHGAEVTQVEFSPDGESLLTASADRTVRLWDLSPIRWPVADLTALAELLSSHRLDSSGESSPLSSAEMGQRWERLRNGHPEYFLPR